jgi:PAS domain S-box-containing protein
MSAPAATQVAGDGMHVIHIAVSDITERKKSEGSLREAAAFLNTILNAIPVPLFYKDTDGRYIGFNKSYEEFYGKTQQELVGKSVFDIAPVDLAEVYHAKDLELFHNPGAQVYDSQVKDARGAVHDVVFHKSTFSDPQGGVLGLIGVILDITERKRAEEALRQSEEKFAKVFNYAPVLITLTSFDEGTFLDVNDKFCEVSGFSRVESIGKTSVDIGWASPEDRRRMIEELQTHGIVRGMDLKLLTKDKREIHCVYSGEFIQTKSGRLLLSIAHDITELRHTEEALRNSEERFRKMFEQGPIGIAILDLDYRWVAVNKRLCEITGYTSDELTKLTFIDITHPEDVDKDVAQAEALAIGAIDYYQMEKRYIKKNKEIVWINLWGSIVRNGQGVPSYFLAMIEDITSAKKSEQERKDLQSQLFESQKMAAIATLIGGIAHDFNNIFQIILSASQLLLSEKSQDDSDYQLLEYIVNHVLGGADVVNRLLMFGKEASIRMVTVDLNHQINDLTTLISRTLPHVVQFDVDLADGLAMIHADPNQVDQVVMNLAINASEAMTNGGQLKIATKTVSLDDEYCGSHRGVKPGNYVMLSVSDTGIGMDKETLARIFDPFFSTKEKGSTRGTGLGLCVVQGILRQHDAHITCESEQGKGTEFKVYFPSIASQRKTKKKSGLSPESGQSRTVLLVEDEPGVADCGRRILTSAGYSVITATNGRKALEIYRLRKDEISLVILDLIMPEMSGRDCLMELLKIDPSVKVLIAAGYTPEDELHREIRPLVKGFLQKPFAIAELLNQARSVLDIDWNSNST